MILVSWRWPKLTNSDPKWQKISLLCKKPDEWRGEDRCTIKILKYPSEREILGSRQELAPNINRAPRLDKARPTQLT